MSNYFVWLHCPRALLANRVSQVLSKYALLDDCNDGSSLLSAWAIGNLERQAAHEQAKAVCSQIEDACGLSIAAFKAPSWCNLRPVDRGEHRVKGDGNVSFICDKNVTPHTFVAILPRDALTLTFPIVTHCIDRGSIWRLCCVLHGC